MSSSLPGGAAWIWISLCVAGFLENAHGFELCQSFKGHRLWTPSQPNSSLLTAGTTRATTHTCTAAEVPITSCGDSGCDTTCCPAAELWCAGCGNGSQHGCDQCSGGFINVGGSSDSRDTRCEACMDTPAWINKDGKTCVQLEKAECTDEDFHFLSSNMACCQCGGGHRQATSFAYFTPTLVLGQDASVTGPLGRPIPRTASHYSIDQACPLLDYNLTLNATTGEVELAKAGHVKPSHGVLPLCFGGGG